MINKPFYLMLICSLFLASCYYDNEEDLYPGECDTANVSYKDDVSKIISQSCLPSCHSAAFKQGNVDLEGYYKVKVYVDNYGLLGSIRHESGYNAMPKNQSKLSPCNISMIEKWIEQGALDN